MFFFSIYQFNSVYIFHVLFFLYNSLSFSISHVISLSLPLSARSVPISACLSLKISLIRPYTFSFPIYPPFYFTSFPSGFSTPYRYLRLLYLIFFLVITPALIFFRIFAFNNFVSFPFCLPSFNPFLSYYFCIYS